MGRNEARLTGVAEECIRRGAAVDAMLSDVRDRARMQDLIEHFERRHGTDLVFANAGVTGGARANSVLEPSELALVLMETNVQGVMNTIHPLFEPMLARGHGQIVLVGSLAGFVTLPDAPSYCASKHAVLTYGLALREAVRHRNIKVNVVCPGYVRTPMSDQLAAWKILEISAEDAAARIARGIERNRPIIAFPPILGWLSRFGGILPDWLLQFGSRPFRFKVK